MGIAQALNARTLELRKQRDELAASFQSVQGFAQASAKERALKGGDSAVNDEDAQRAIQKAIKQVRDTIEQLEAGQGQTTDLYKRSTRELTELEALLPALASDEQVAQEARMFILAQDVGDLSMKLMGPTMAHLTAHFGAALDKSKASGIIRGLLTTK